MVFVEAGYIPIKSTISGKRYKVNYGPAERTEESPLTDQENNNLIAYKERGLLSWADLATVWLRMRKNCRKEQPDYEKNSIESHYEKMKRP